MEKKLGTVNGKTTGARRGFEGGCEYFEITAATFLTVRIVKGITHGD